MTEPTTETELARRKCAFCEGGVAPMAIEQAEPLMAQISKEWQIEGANLVRTFKWHDFQGAMRFVNRVAEIAEAEGHHPDIHISWNKVRLELSTHSIGGLSENDFILAAKIDELM